MHERDKITGCVALALSLGLFACEANSGTEADTDSEQCVGLKCDDAVEGESTGDPDPEPDDDGSDADAGGDSCEIFELDPEQVLPECQARADVAFNPNRRSFQPQHLRWSCADVDGRMPTERGQEYCEYFAIVDLPTAYNPEILGLNLGDDFDAGQTPFGIELDATTIAALEAAPQDNVGACVFTSWNADIGYSTRGFVPYVHRVPLTSDVFQMKFFSNSLEAAGDLIDHCISCVPLPGEESDPDDALHKPFQRACYLNAELNGTEDRKSDTVICAAAMRAGECGCNFADPNRNLFRELADAAALGFPLGTWDDPKGLPPGCEFQPFGPSGQNVVTCELSAAEVLQNASELKAYCAERYAEDVVVHIPIPQGDIECMPWEDEPYAATCSETPWLLSEQGTDKG